MKKHNNLATACAALLALTGLACGSNGNSGGDNNNNESDGGSSNDASASDSAVLDAGGPDANPSAPTCIITTPGDGSEQPYDSDWTFIAQANDLEDGPLSGPSIQWVSDVIGPLGNGASLTLVLDPPYTHQITCIATDTDGLTGSNTITVNATSPVVEIWHPGDGENRQTCPVDIPFTGNARSYEDGDISSAILWSSDQDGPLNGGNPTNSFNECLDGAGNNVITAEITDSDSNVATDSLTLIIAP